MTSPDRAILDPEIRRRIANLTLTARKAVEGMLSGVHRSPHRGASVVFVEHREYRPGDDLRLLDWRAYARSDRHTIKRFEQEGTYPLPEAQLDRFLFQIDVGYPSAAEEAEIVRRTTAPIAATPEPVLTREEILDLQDLVPRVPVAAHVIEHAVSRTSSCIDNTDGASRTAWRAPRSAPVVCSTIVSSSAWLG